VIHRRRHPGIQIIGSEHDAIGADFGCEVAQRFAREHQRVVIHLLHVGQEAVAVQVSVQIALRLRMNDDDHALLGLRPEPIEFPLGDLLAGDAAANRRAAQSQLSHGIVELLRREIGKLQRDRRQGGEAIGARVANRGEAHVLQRDDGARHVAVDVVPVPVDAEVRAESVGVPRFGAHAFGRGKMRVLGDGLEAVLSPFAVRVGP
jgi:hypothetical protein